jgi:hypothetical protein
LIVAMDVGGYFASVSLDNPGKPMMKFLRSASAKVGNVGLKSVAWLKATISAGLVDWLTADAAYSVALWGISAGNVIFHSFGVVCERSPLIITLLLRCIIASVAVNVHVQSASHSFPMLSRLVFCRAGNNSVVVASLGTLGRFRFAVWVDTIVEPSGSVTVTGAVVGRLLLHGTFMPLKWPVDPVSAIAMLDVGGPSWIVLFLRVVTTI